MSSPSQLWAPQPEDTTPSAAEKMNSLRSDMLPGTWLQLSPAVSPQFNAERQVRPVDVKDELSLSSGVSSAIEIPNSNAGFLSNDSASSPSSSVSRSTSYSSPSTRKPSFLSAPVAPCAERREMAIGRIGGLASAFLSN